MAVILPDYKFYVFLRSDLDSMNTGKAAAQVSHAASDFAAKCMHTDEYKAWCEDRTFGTAIVKDGGNLKNLPRLEEFNILGSGMIHDPSYPIRDGKVTHLIPLDTCYWLFTDSSWPGVYEELYKYKLYD